MKKKFQITWLDECDQPCLKFFCYFREDEPETNGQENTPFLDPACTVNLEDSGIWTPESYGSMVEEV